MKLFSYITLIAAFAFGMNNTNAVAATHNTVDIEALSGGNVQANFDEASETINLRISPNGTRDRVLILLSNVKGDIVYKDKVIVSGRGVAMEIPMAGLEEGLYFLRVKGATISYSDRFKKK